MQKDHTTLAAKLARSCGVTPGRRDCRLLETLARDERALLKQARRASARAKAGETLEPAWVWLLDNYAYLDAQMAEIREALPRGYYRYLPRAASGPYRGEPRVWQLVCEVLAHAGPGLSVEVLREFFLAYQEVSVLSIAELWAIPPMLKLALVRAIARAAENDAADPNAIPEALATLRQLEAVPWRDFVESISAVDAILREDPAGVYAKMEFETRDAYRHAVEGFARASRREETAVASLAVALAREPGAEPHVGYYLAGPGVRKFKKRAGCRTPLAARVRGWAYACPNAVYLGGVLVALALLLWGFRAALDAPWWALGPLLLPASHAAIAVVNPFVHRLFPPRRLPRMDAAEGIPDDCRTFVVVPTLLLSNSGVESLLNNLEIHYLANRDPNLLFALLTDFPDWPTPEGPLDNLLETAIDGIKALNSRYRDAPFYLFHRKRVWNESEGVWMGRERKRGKLEDFNRFLLGIADGFDVKVGDLEGIGQIRYVITLDSDTQLPRDTARKLVAAMAHPLNRPKFDETTGAVRRGYALMQPRISISMESAGRSRLARIYSGQTGFDPYATAVSDVYQDLHGRGSFTGKGIYDLRAFHRALDGRFPENALLSHDLIEGEHTGVGLLTDLEMIDDYPATHEAWSKRKHRWVRGDWQILPWLFSRVPGPDGPRKNALGLLARWKIFDNLRRSLLEPSLVALLAAAWFTLPNPTLWTLAALACLVLPAYVELALACVRLPPARFWSQYFREVAWRFGRAHADAALQVVFLAQQACLMADAVGRTLVRLFFTHRRLLEWESAAQAEQSAGRGPSLPSIYLFASPVVALGAALAMPYDTTDASLPVLVLEAWIFAPLVARWLNGRPRARRRAAGDTAFLHDVALRTWRYFADYCREEEHWLVPDNVQEDPPAIAHRASPTNIGLLATANVAACDFGYLTTTEMASRLERMLRTMSRLPRCRGHFYNWYDTSTLEVLDPPFVSTVDSGNLAASLLTMGRGCLERLERPALEAALLAGLRDHALRLRDALPQSARSSSVMRLVSSLLRQLEYRPSDLFFWESVLTEAAQLVRRIGEHLEWECRRLEAEGEPGEVRYWYRALAERMDAAVEELYAVAPWLARPFEMDLRQSSGVASMAAVTAELSRVVPLGELPAQYAAAARAIGGRLEAPQPLPRGLRRTLTAVLETLAPARARAEGLIERLEEHAAVAAGFVQEMDFAFLFDRKRKLLRIGYDARSGRLEEGYYDLLASEARTAVFLGIAKGDLPREAWFHLGRKLTAWRGCRTLLSWSGTLFEYLMPCLFMETYSGTLLGASLKEVVRMQQLYGRERRVPWGISESACAVRDSSLCYQYKAFGIPQLGVQRRRADELVIAPYATLLALMVDRAAAAANLRAMAARGWLARHGYYEAVDYTNGCEVVRSFMAHHQGMALMALANVLHDGIMRRRFHAEPSVQATEYLLQERAPAIVEVRATIELEVPEKSGQRSAVGGEL